MKQSNQAGQFFGHTALLVEDNDRLRHVLEVSLAEFGFAVTSAPTGDGAQLAALTPTPATPLQPEQDVP